MAARYQRARLAIAGALAAGVISGTAYFAGTVPKTSAGDSSGGSISNVAEATRAPATSVRVKRSRGS